MALFTFKNSEELLANYVESERNIDWIYSFRPRAARPSEIHSYDDRMNEAVLRANNPLYLFSGGKVTHLCSLSDYLAFVANCGSILLALSFVRAYSDTFLMDYINSKKLDFFKEATVALDPYCSDSIRFSRISVTPSMVELSSIESIFDLIDSSMDGIFYRQVAKLYRASVIYHLRRAKGLAKANSIFDSWALLPFQFIGAGGIASCGSLTSLVRPIKDFIKQSQSLGFDRLIDEHAATLEFIEHLARLEYPGGLLCPIEPLPI